MSATDGGHRLSQAEAISGRRKFVALFPAALTAWAIIAARILAPAVLELLSNTESAGYLPNQIRSLALLLAVFGIPMAIVVTLILGSFAWIYVESRRLTKVSDAIKVGAFAGLAAFLGDALLTALAGLPTALDPNSSYDAGVSGGETIHDGLPTAYGWLLKLVDLPVDIIAGSAAGWVSWTVAGFGKKTG